MRASRGAFVVLLAAGVLLPALLALSPSLGAGHAPTPVAFASGSHLRSSETPNGAPSAPNVGSSLSPLTAQNLEWIPLSGFSDQAPSARGGDALAFDPATGSTILFGGDTNGYSVFGGPPMNDTWSLANGSWSELAPPTVPPASEGDSLAYDPAIGALLLVAVTHTATDSAWSSTTWSFSSGTWTELTGAGHADPFAYASMAYDPSRGALVRFGGLTVDGYGASQESNRTQIFDNGSWRNATPGPAPPGSFGSAAAYDPTLGGIVLFGGESAVAELNETWMFGDSGWTELAPTHHPSARVGASAAWDPRLGAVVLSGGTDALGMYWGYDSSANRTWVLQAGDWNSVPTPSAIPVVAMGAGAFDAQLGAVVSFGGWGYPNATDAAAQYDVGQYYGLYNPTFAVARAPAPDAQVASGPHEVGVPVGFSDLLRSFSPNATDLWTFGDGGSSSVAAPSHTFATPGTFSADLNASLVLPDGVSWGESNATVTILPALGVRVGASGSFTDPYRPIQIAAALTGGAAPFDLNWSFGDGSSGNGSLVVQHAYASPGTYQVRVLATDALGVARAALATVHVEPFAQAYIAVASTFYDLGQTLTLSTDTVNGSGPLSFSYEGLPDGCASVNSRNLTCVPTSTGAYSIEALVRDVDGVTVGSPLQTVVIYPPLSATLHASSTAIDVGQSFSLGAAVDSFGSGNVSLTLPTNLGCFPVAAFQAVCTPGSPGLYPIAAMVVDRAGVGVSLTTMSVVVSPRVALNATGPGTPIARGTVYVLALQTSGGTAPYRYSYTSLPEGCVSLNASTFRCYAAQTGALAFGATVLDAVGGNATAHLVVYVTGESVGPAPFVPPSAPPSLPGGVVFWLVVAAAVVEIVLSIRYARRPRRRRRSTVRKGLWSEAESAPLDGFDDDGALGTEPFA
ncbi:MAG: PKD domain-containing protein [Thermoplasmata archaeon]|nr:PKD domain-containing protein [Thermoplasmata archaeon]MCI4355522.1 PKD domain-containing protein [Thermoplasmata archaeon]